MSNPIVRVSTDGGKTWKDYLQQQATNPAPATTNGAIALVMHAKWMSNSEFDQIAKGLNSSDKIRYRCTKYPDDFDSARWTHVKSYRTKVGVKIGFDCGYWDNIVQHAAKFKELGADFVEYNLENAFDGPNTNDATIQNRNLEQIRKASEAVRAQGMSFTVAPGKPNTTTFKNRNMLDDVARLVDHYHMQAQSLQDTPTEYANFVSQMSAIIRQAKPAITITSQVTTNTEYNATGKTSFETCKTAASAAMSKPAPGNINGIGMWIKGSEIQTAIDFFAWFRTTYPS